jgi:serine/threonine protein kinase
MYTTPSIDDLHKFSEAGDWEVKRSEIEMSCNIGQGSFGNVMMATWRGTPVAVKQLIDVNIDITELRTDFLALTKLHHPNIIQILGACTETKPVWIMTELMTGNLQKYDSTNTKFSQSIEWCIDVTRGLAYLHNRIPKCVIHRDLKPTNLLLTVSKRVKICDFGLSCFQQSSEETYNMTSETGTYRYMAPEIITAKPYNSSVDIFSFSMIAYKLFETIPYPYYEPVEICKSIKNGERPEFRNLKRQSDLKLLISDCWNSDPSKRPNALQIIDKLNKIKHTKNKSMSGCLNFL